MPPNWSVSMTCKPKPPTKSQPAMNGKAIAYQSPNFRAGVFSWGLGGMIVTVMMGIVWGTAYLLCGRNLWIVILAHSAGHILLVIQLYLAKSIII